MSLEDFSFAREAWWRDYCREFLRKKGLGPPTPGTDHAIGRVMPAAVRLKNEVLTPEQLVKLMENT